MLRQRSRLQEAANAVQYEGSSAGQGRKASIPAVVNSEISDLSEAEKEKERKGRVKASIAIEHTDIIKDDFWDQRPWLLSGDSQTSNNA